MRRIFLLEDDKDIRELIELILQSKNYSVISFACISDFLNRNIIDLPDLFILDVRLPDGSGLDVCKKLRSAADPAAPPIMIMSAHASLQQMNMECKADIFMDKPFDVDLFLENVRNQVEK